MNEPTEEQPAPPLTDEQMMALALEAAKTLKEAQERYAAAKAASMRDAQGRVLVQPFVLQLEIDTQRVRLDAMMMVLSEMGINLALPVAQLMPRLFDHLTAELGKVRIANAIDPAVRAALNSKKREN
jgi:hypothetical protein